MPNVSFLLTGIIIISLSCSSQRKSQNQSNNLKAEKLNVSSRENAENKIVFLTLNMTLLDSVKDTYSFTLTNTIFAEGTLQKKSFNNNISIEPFYLYCEISDESKKRIDMIKVQNPLMKVFEYSPDKTILEKKLFTSTSGELYLRFQFTRNSKYLTIYKPQNDLQTLKKIYYAQI